MEILVICGAGASSTFVAQRLRKAAAGAAADLTISAGAVPVPGGTGPAPALILLGAHLADRHDELSERFAPAPVVLLPADIGTDLDGSRTLAIVQQYADLSSEPQKGSS